METILCYFIIQQNTSNYLFTHVNTNVGVKETIWDLKVQKINVSIAVVLIPFNNVLSAMYYNYH